MRRSIAVLALLVVPLLAGSVGAQEAPPPKEKASPRDDFKREGNEEKRKAKDPLEGKAPPALQVRDWTNTDGKALKLADFKGKVVVLKFWGVW